MGTRKQVVWKRPGFEYGYRFWMDHEVFSSYRYTEKKQPICERGFLFEVRTFFILKPTRFGKDKVMDSERFASFLVLTDDPADGLKKLSLRIKYRLFEYWFSMKEIDRAVEEAFRFAKRIEANPLNASLRVLPFVLGIDVCTVQLQGESLDATVDRLIKPDCLIPFPVWGLSMVPEVEHVEIEFDLRCYLVGLPRERVEDVDKALARMEMCPICFRPPTFGAQLTPLPCNRNHVFLNHCIIRWLIVKRSCPLCRFEIVINKNTALS